MRVAIVGAGWAGLAAASFCHRAGHHATLIEASRQVGGRARGVQDPRLGAIDNGQHILLGAYEQTLNLMRQDLGDERLDLIFDRQPLALASADGYFEIKAKTGLPAAFGHLVGFLTAKGLRGSDKWRILQFLWRLKRQANRPQQGWTVSQWLKNQGQPQQACRWLWHPLCLATLNTNPQQACANLFATVLSRSLLNPQAGATDLLLPATDLSKLWPDHVVNQVPCQFGHRVQHITATEDSVQIDGQTFDACILAVAPHSLNKLLESHRDMKALCQQLSGFSYNPITTCYVALCEPYQLPAPMLMLDHGESETSLGHWVFDRRAILRDSQHTQADLAFVISDSSAVLGLEDHQLARDLVDQLTRALRSSAQIEISATRCIHEKRATFAATVGLQRPGYRLPWPRVALAGDWTDTGLPAVIEGAVQSGLQAAQYILGRYAPSLKANDNNV